MAQARAGTYTGMDALNAQYGPVDIELSEFGDQMDLQFSNLYHAEVLAEIYAVAEGVIYSGANFSVGSPSSDLDRQSSTRYRIWHGWVSCPTGCLFQRYWVLEIVAGHTVLVESAGSIPPDGDFQVGAPPAYPQAGNVLLPATPNPFNPTTTVPYFLGAPGHVSLEMFDSRGRHIRTLVDAWRPAGKQLAVLSLAGSKVASGTYVLRLSVDGLPVGAQRIALVR